MKKMYSEEVPKFKVIEERISENSTHSEKKIYGPSIEPIKFRK